MDTVPELLFKKKYDPQDLGLHNYHIFSFNMNEWVLRKGQIEVMPSNSVSTSNWYRSSTKT